MRMIAVTLIALWFAPGSCFESKKERCPEIDATGDIPHPGVDLFELRGYNRVQDGDPAFQVDAFVLGPFPPPATTYSWFIEVTMQSTDANGVTTTIEVVRQYHDGVHETIITGVPDTAVTVTESERGIVVNVVIPDSVPWNVTDTQWQTRSGYLEQNGGTIQYDRAPEGGYYPPC